MSNTDPAAAAALVRELIAKIESKFDKKDPHGKVGALRGHLFILALKADPKHLKEAIAIEDGC